MTEGYKIGYIGLGSLGTAIFSVITSFAKDHSLENPKGWNRTQSEYPKWRNENEGCEYVESLDELVLSSNVIFTCLVNDQAALEVYARISEILESEEHREGEQVKVFADQSTLKPGTAREFLSP